MQLSGWRPPAHRGGLVSGTVMLNTALRFAEELRWPVFPLHAPTGGRCSCGKHCDQVGKHPRTAHGHKEATTDAAQIKEWWGRWDDANIGVATGFAFDVLDLDNDTAGQWLGNHAADLGYDTSECWGW